MKFEVNKDTYMTIEEADSIIEDEFDSESIEYKLWSQLDEKGKQRLILKGTRLSDRLPYIGTQVPGNQSMRWPRLIQWQPTECPYDIKLGILKQSIRDSINTNKQEHKLQELGVKSYSIKGASITFTENKVNCKLTNGMYEDIFHECFGKWVY
jgi:hypothetical protein